MTRIPLTLTPDQIARAREAGIIPADEANALLDAADPGAPLIGNEEDLRFLRSFSDIFITIGVVLLGLGMFAVSEAVDPRGFGWGLLGAAGLFWLLSEYFGRVRRAHLPTLMLSLAFALALGGALFQLFADRFVSVGTIGADWFVPTALFLLGMGFYYWRVRLPFCMALLAWGVVAFVFGVAGSLGLLPNLWAVIALVLVCAAGVETAALLYDIRDPERERRFSDNGFWLHTVASPLTLLALMGLGAKITLGDSLSALEDLARIRDDVDGLAVWMAAVIVASILWGLAVNRRVFVVSTLAYALAVIVWALTRLDFDGGLVTGLALFGVGGAVVLLGVGWHPARRMLLRALPTWPIFPRPARTDI